MKNVNLYIENKLLKTILISVALIAVVFVLLFIAKAAVFAHEAEEYSNSAPVAYMDWNDSTKQLEEKTCTNYELLTGKNRDMYKDKWYVVKGDVHYGNRMHAYGENVHIILTDGATLNVDNGIECSDTNSLTVYCQSGMTGAINAKAESEDAAIGGTSYKDGNNITINGGKIYARGGSNGAGIGGGYRGEGSKITINAGEINAFGGSGAAAIGGGFKDVGRRGVDITINGGNVNATGGDCAAGIGGGDNGEGQNITINGGHVIAKGGDDGAGIGGSDDGGANGIYINGGMVEATGVDGGAGIGGGDDGDAANIIIKGGDVTAKGGEDGAGIGGGDYKSATNIHIFGGKVFAESAKNGVCIGRGDKGSASGVFVNDDLDIMRFDSSQFVPHKTNEDIAAKLNLYRGILIDKFEAKVTYDFNYEGAPEPQSYSFGSTMKYSHPESKYNSIIGWFTEKEGGQLVNNGSELPTKQNHTLYAHWNEIKYIGWNETSKQLEEKSIKTYTTGDKITRNLNANEWYVVNGELSFSERMYCYGSNIHLVLTDGCKLTLPHGLDCSDRSGYASLTIHGQAGNTGKLIANACKHDAAIGGLNGKNGTNITIDGGIIEARGGEYAAGIGGGDNGHGTFITINGGEVAAWAGEKGAGIGGGDNCEGQNITINGGKVRATGCDIFSTAGTLCWGGGAGIGGGDDGGAQNIIINNGDVRAFGSETKQTFQFYGNAGAAAIGGGADGSCETVIINGGKVYVEGGVDGAGIGSGEGKDCNGIFINDGSIEVVEIWNGAGIGSGNKGAANLINIAGGKVKVRGGEKSAAIGSGQYGNATNIKISGGLVEANGDLEGAGIGCGRKGQCDKIEITGGNVFAYAGPVSEDYYKPSAGIGASGEGTASNIVITGGKVHAIGARGGRGIGSSAEIINKNIFVAANLILKVDKRVMEHKGISEDLSQKLDKNCREISIG